MKSKIGVSEKNNAKTSSNGAKLLEMILGQLTHLGGLVFYIIITIFVLTIGKIIIFEELLVVLVTIMVVAIIIRMLYHKERPEKKKYETIFERIDSSSFPSLHSMRAVALAIIIGNSFAAHLQKIFLGIIAILVIYSRIKLKKHYIEDALLGAILGAGIALLVLLVLK